jgi:serine protease inhibitor
MRKHFFSSFGIIVAAGMGLAILGVAFAVPAQQPAGSAAAAPQSNTGAQAAGEAWRGQLVAANTRFGFKLFSEIRKRDANQNIFISPASLALALAMTYNGAGGQTGQAIAKTLELQQLSLQQVNLGNAALKASLANLDAKVNLAIANSLWGRQGEPFKPEFIKRTQDFYGAQVRNVDFGAPNAPDVINRWVKQSTNSKIDKILEKNDIDASTIAVLINAIYFHADWMVPFAKEKTQARPFTLSDGSQKQHPMMFQKVDYASYYKNEMFQAIGLPYGEGRLSMYIFLPHQGVSLKTFYENLNAQNWEKWMNQFRTEEKGVILGLPRFHVEYEIDLKESLKALGMEKVFDAGADFTEITPQGFAISKIKHKTFLDVSEEGTEAAGVTAVGGTRGGVPDITMIVDRPFFCAIRDEETGTILFMGSIVDPK